jgi:hypothetical protein
VTAALRAGPLLCAAHRDAGLGLERLRALNFARARRAARAPPRTAARMAPTYAAGLDASAWMHLAACALAPSFARATALARRAPVVFAGAALLGASASLVSCTRWWPRRSCSRTWASPACARGALALRRPPLGRCTRSRARCSAAVLAVAVALGGRATLDDPARSGFAAVRRNSRRRSGGLSARAARAGAVFNEISGAI